MEKMLLKIANELESQNFEDLKHLSEEKVPRTVLRESKKPIELLTSRYGSGNMF